LVRPLGVETTKPDGNVSEKPMPLTPDVVFRFMIVKVRVVLPFNGTLAPPNAWAIVGGPITMRVAVLLVEPVPPSLDVMAPVVLFRTPKPTPVTFKEMVHDPPGVSDVLFMLREVAPEFAVTEPLQVVVRLLGVATANPAGRLSVKATLCKVTTVFTLVMVKFKLVEPPTGTDAAPNDLLIVGGAATVMPADAVLPVPPLVEVTAPLRLFF